jgi:SAM-dependent methyltransferase
MGQLYDDIGRGYAETRRPDPRLAELIRNGLGDARSVVNVGAGAGSYEPTDRRVFAVEPSSTMIRQRASAAAPAIQGSAMELPFSNDSFDAALAILTLHHWPDWRVGVRELLRVSRGQVLILSWDPAVEPFWLGEYFPEIWQIDRQIFPPLQALCNELGGADVRPIPIPHDCTDGFLGAYWRRPEAYLDPAVRASISTFSRISRLRQGIGRLRTDLESGKWEEQNGLLRMESELDLGYRLIQTKA